MQQNQFAFAHRPASHPNVRPMIHTRNANNPIVERSTIHPTGTDKLLAAVVATLKEKDKVHENLLKNITRMKIQSKKRNFLSSRDFL